MSDLQCFLETSYGDVELRAPVFEVFADSPTMHASVPGSGASVQEIALHIAVNLLRHHERPPLALWAVGPPHSRLDAAGRRAHTSPPHSMVLQPSPGRAPVCHRSVGRRRRQGPSTARVTASR